MKVQKVFSTVSFHVLLYTVFNKNICFTVTILKAGKEFFFKMLDFSSVPVSKQMLKSTVIAHDEKSWTSNMETC